jgi:hypothetical protein
MTLCWNAKAQDRPPFKILYRELEIIERELVTKLPNCFLLQ